MVDQAILSTKGTDIAVTVGSPVAGDKVVVLNANGKAVAAPVSPILPGDKVTLINTPGGTVAYKVNPDRLGNESADVDPCKALSIVVDPDNPKYFLISWTPGDNNDSCHLEVDTTAFIVHPDASGEAHYTIPINQTTLQKSAIRYFAWHYVTIWGMRSGKYSTITLQAQAILPLTSIFQYLKMYVSAAYRPLPPGWATYSGWLYTVPWNSDDALVGDSYVNIPNKTEYGAAWLTVGCYFGQRLIPDLYDSPVKVTIISPLDHPLFGMSVTASEEALGTDVQCIDVTSLMAEGYSGGILLEFQDPKPHPGIDWPDPDFIMYKYTSEPRDPIEGTSWWVYGNLGADQGYNGESSAYIRLDGSGGFRIDFYDGSHEYGYAFIQATLTDPDNGVFKIWAKVSGTYDAPTGHFTNKHHDQSLYWGDILLCDNFQWNTGTEYHGYLGISLLNLDD